MRKLMVALVAACAAGVAVADEFVPPEGSELRAGEEHPDWAAECSDGSVTIPSGKTWVAYEDDMKYISQLKENRLTINAGTTFVMDGVTTRPGGLALGGKGTWVVRNSPSYKSNYQYDFYGTLVVENGVFEQTTYYPVDAMRGATIRILDGATYRMNGDQASNGDITFIAEGAGYEGQGGAIVLDKGCHVGYLVLSNDVTVVQNSAGAAFAAYTYPGSGRCATRDPAQIDLNGHTLTLAGTSSSVGFSGCRTEGEGTIEVGALAGDATRTVQVSGATVLGAACTLAVPHNAVVQFRNVVSKSQSATLVAGGNLKFTYACDSWVNPPAADAVHNVWAGPIQLADGATLTVDPGNAARQISLTGPISGAANVQFGVSGTLAKGTVLLSGVNTYTGTTKVFGEAAFKLFLSQGASIPDFAKLSVSGGAVYPSIDYDAEGGLTWTADSVLAFAQAQGNTTVTIDGTKAKAIDDLRILPADVAKYFPNFGLTWDAYGKTGGYTLEGPYPVETPLNLNVLAGTVRVTGEGPIHLGEATVSGTSAASSGTLILDGAEDVVYSNQIFTVGSTSTSLTSPIARMIVTNSTLRSTAPSFVESDFAKSALYVGRNATGILEVEAGSVLSNKLCVGGGKTYSSGDGVGAVYQRGGFVAPHCGGAAHYTSNIGNAGHGYYELAGGTFRPTGTMIVECYAVGIFIQTGGLAQYPGLTVQASNGDAGYYAVLGGTSEFIGNTGSFCNAMGNSGTSYVTVQGEGSLFSTKDSVYRYIYCCSGDKNHASVFNLNDGGVLEYGGFNMYSDAYTQLPAGAVPLLVNFNGGVARACGTSYSTLFRGGQSKYDAKVVVYEKGAQIDTTLGPSDSSNWGGRLEAMREGGIQSINLPEGGLTGYYASPRVKITGSGYGATALALLDSRTSTITNILMTSHGWGYDPATTKVYLQYNTTTKYTVPTNNIVIADNEIGGFTKLGPNGFTLNYTNEFAKWTRVLGGTLKAGCDKAIPSGTYLTLSNDATLDLNNVSDATFTGVDGTGGTVANGTVKIVGEWEISAKKFIDRETTAVVGTLDLTECTGITLVDTEVLDDAAMGLKRLDLFTATEVLGLEDVEISGAPKDWRFTKTPNGLRLAPPGKGLLMIIGSNSGSSSAARETVRYDGADVEIVVAANAPKTVKFAASELQNF